MSTFDEDTKKLVNTQCAIKMRLDAVLTEFLSACMMGDRGMQEDLRAKAHDILDSHMDAGQHMEKIVAKHGGLL